MIAKILYGTTSLVIFGFGLYSYFFPVRLKNMMQILLDKELFYIPGLLEILISLLLLYFRHSTSLPFVNTVIGVLIFVDGIFYLTGNQILKDTFEQILDMDDNVIKNYSIIFFIIATILVGSIF